MGDRPRHPIFLTGFSTDEVTKRMRLPRSCRYDTIFPDLDSNWYAGLPPARKRLVCVQVYPSTSGRLQAVHDGQTQCRSSGRGENHA